VSVKQAGSLIPKKLYIYVTTYMSEGSYDQKSGIYYISIRPKNIEKQLCYS